MDTDFKILVVKANNDTELNIELPKLIKKLASVHYIQQ
jgi:hypothetical protein